MRFHSTDDQHASISRVENGYTVSIQIPRENPKEDWDATERKEFIFSSFEEAVGKVVDYFKE